MGIVKYETNVNGIVTEYEYDSENRVTAVYADRDNESDALIEYE